MVTKVVYKGGFAGAKIPAKRKNVAGMELIPESYCGAIYIS
jgi:hypothetical protein